PPRPHRPGRPPTSRDAEAAHAAKPPQPATTKAAATREIRGLAAFLIPGSRRPGVPGSRRPGSWLPAPGCRLPVPGPGSRRLGVVPDFRRPGPGPTLVEMTGEYFAAPGGVAPLGAKKRR